MKLNLNLKRILINALIVVVFLIIYFLQANFFSWFTIAGIMPNLFVILVLILGLFAGKIYGTIYGIVFGFLLDLFIGNTVGITSAMLGIVGFIGGIFSKNFSKDSRLIIMLMIMALTGVYEIGIYFFEIIFNGVGVELIAFLKILIVEVVYNGILSIILYPILRIFGDYIEGELKMKKIIGIKYF